MSRRGIYGDRLAKIFNMDSAPSFVTRTRKSALIAVTEIKCDSPHNGFTQPIPAEDALLLQLQLKDCPAYELWVTDHHIHTEPLKAGATSFYNLEASPMAYSVSPFHSLNFYLPRQALDYVADIEGVPRMGALQAPLAGVEDAVINGLGAALRPAFLNPEEANRLFIDHIEIALAAHVIRTYGCQSRVPLGPDRLSQDQEAFAKEIIEEHLHADLELPHLAGTLEMSVMAFVNAFQGSTGKLPHQWLLSRRIDRATDLLRRSDMSVAQIALACGFASERHFKRVFLSKYGTFPCAWRARA